MNIPYNVSKGRRPKSYVAKVGFLAADFLDSSPNGWNKMEQDWNGVKLIGTDHYDLLTPP